jgi:hypothetical protein
MAVTLSGAGPAGGSWWPTWMRRRGVMAALTAAAAVVLAGAGSAAAATPAAAAGDGWGRAVAVPGLGRLNAGGSAQVLSVSCWRSGDCSAGGFYTDHGLGTQAFVVTEQDGRWGKAAAVAGIRALHAGGEAQVLSVSCAAGGDCAAGGFYTTVDGLGSQGFVVTRRDGRWGKAAEVGQSSQNVQVVSVSCAPGGYCAAGGLSGDSLGFVVTERGGRWGNAQVPPGLAALNTGGNAAVVSVSCPSAGNCAAGGFYQTDVMDADDGNPVEPFVVSQARGRWGSAKEIPGIEALNLGWDSSVVSLSCPSAGNCGAGGFLQFASFDSQACDVAPARTSGARPAGPAQPPDDCAGSFVVSEKNGRWGTAQDPRYPGMDQVVSVSCPSAGNCSAGGYSGYSPAVTQAYVLTERNGRWGRPLEVPGTAQLDEGTTAQITSVSCWSPGNCGAGGYYTERYGRTQAFVVSERNGRWGTAEEVPGTAALNLGKTAQVTSVSCTRPRACAAGGYYTDGSGHIQAFAGGEAH